MGLLRDLGAASPPPSADFFFLRKKSGCLRTPVARRQDLLKIQRKCYGQNCLHRTDTGGVDPVVVVIVQVAEGEPMSAVLVCCLEGICCLHTTTKHGHLEDPVAYRGWTCPLEHGKKQLNKLSKHSDYDKTRT